MKQTLYVRKKNRITSPEGVQVFPSINAAKRASRKLQPVSGDGTLRIER